MLSTLAVKAILLQLSLMITLLISVSPTLSKHVHLEHVELTIGQFHSIGCNKF